MAKRRRVRAKDYRSIRNLAQYKDLSEDEFLEKMRIREANKELKPKVKPDKTISERAEEKLEEFEQDYDLSDLKSNDREALNSLINATIMLEDFEKQIHEIQMQGITESNLTLMDKLNKMASDLRSDIIKYQDSLMITRKIRKSGTEESTRSYLEMLKEKADKFYKSKMNYIYCPKCKMLLSTVWLLFPDEKINTIRLKCVRILDDGTEDGKPCNTEVIVKVTELIKNRNRNITDVPNF